MIKVLHLRRRLISDKSSVRWKEYGKTSTGVDGDCDDGGGSGGEYLRRLNNYEKIHHNFYTQWAYGIGVKIIFQVFYCWSFWLNLPVSSVCLPVPLAWNWLFIFIFILRLCETVWKWLIAKMDIHQCDNSGTTVALCHMFDIAQ